MRHPIRCVAALVAVIAAASCDAIPHSGVLPRDVSVSPGKRVQFTSLLPRWAADTLVWTVEGDPGHGLVRSDGVYCAPFFTPISREVVVRAQLVNEPARTGEAHVTLLDSPPPVAADCYAPSQGGAVAVTPDTPPEPVRKVAPSYPDMAREANVDGTVTVEALVCTSGLVMETRVTKSIPMLDAAAEQAVRHWEFKPALAAGVPVAAWLTVPVKFSLH